MSTFIDVILRTLAKYFKGENYSRMTTIWEWQLFEDDTYSRMTTTCVYLRVATIWEWQLFEDDNYSRMTTIWGWQLFKDDNYWGWRLFKGGNICSTWSSAVTELVQYHCLPSCSSHLLLCCSCRWRSLMLLEFFFLRTLICSRSSSRAIDSCSTMCEHWVHILSTYVYMYVYIYIYVCVYMSVTVHMYVTVLCCNQRIIHCVFWSYHCVQSIVSLNLH